MLMLEMITVVDNDVRGIFFKYTGNYAKYKIKPQIFNKDFNYFAQKA